MTPYPTLTTTHDDRMEYAPSAASPPISCERGRTVTRDECYDGYLEADAFRRHNSPCYRCPTGAARRLARAREVMPCAENAVASERKPSRSPPQKIANEQGLHLLTLLRGIFPTLTAEKLRGWIRKGWPSDDAMRTQIAEALGTTADKVSWRAWTR